MTGPGTPWTGETDATLRRMAAERCSCSVMAREVGRTRNAVIGRLHRLGIVAQSRPPARKPGTCRPKGPGRPRNARPRSWGLPGEGKHVPKRPEGPQPPTPYQEAAPEAGGVLYLKMANGCKYPTNAVVPISEHMACGRPRVISGLPGHPFCQVHSMISIAKRRK